MTDKPATSYVVSVFEKPHWRARQQLAHDDRHASFCAIGRRLAIDNFKTVLAVEGERPIVALKHF